jgi:hypothetical protein
MRVGLPGSTSLVKTLLADPTTVFRGDDIPMTPDEARAWDLKRANIEATGAPLTAYGLAHPEEWAGYFYLDDGTAIAMVSGHAEDHRAAITELFGSQRVSVEVRAVRWSLAQLEGLRTRIREELSWVEKQGLTVEALGPRPEENRLLLVVSTPKVRPGVEQLILDHFDAAGLLRVEQRVVREDGLDSGSLSVAVVDLAGKPVAGVLCVLVPDLTDAHLDDVVRESDGDGRCHWDVMAATAVQVEIWRSYRAGFLAGSRVAVQPGSETSSVITLPF